MWCYQKIGGVKEIPVAVTVVANHGSRMTVQYGGDQYTVNAAAMSSQDPGEARVTWRKQEN